MQVICADGLGGCLSAVSFANLYLRKGINGFFEEIDIHFICSKAVYDALLKIGSDNEFFYHHHNDDIKDIDLAAQLKSVRGDKIYILTPDYFGTVPGFSIDETGITWNQILENRFLDFHLIPKGGVVLLALDTVQDNNSYPFTESLVSKLCEFNPECKFYFPLLENWSNKKIERNLDVNKIKEKYINFSPYKPENLAADLEWIKKNITFFIGVDNGIMNYAYCLGRERILLDSRYGNKAFQMRWRHNGFNDSIPIMANPTEIARAFNLLVKNPELSNLNKYDLITEQNSLFQSIGYKTKEKFNG